MTNSRMTCVACLTAGLTVWVAWAIGGPVAGEVNIDTLHYDHDGVTLEGVLAYDESVSGPRPGVLIVHQWWGRGPQETQRARQLAELGYAAFAVDMYGKGKRTDDPAQAKAWATALYSDREKARDRLGKALSALRDHRSVDPSRVAILGYCFGGAMAFELAYAGAGIDAAISFHGGPMPPMDRDGIESKLLILHGADDPLTPLADMVDLLDTLTANGADAQLHAFGGAQHSFTDPTADEHGIEGVRYDAAADRRSWAQMKLLFAEVWGDLPVRIEPRQAAVPTPDPTGEQDTDLAADDPDDTADPAATQPESE